MRYLLLVNSLTKNIQIPNQIQLLRAYDHYLSNFCVFLKNWLGFNLHKSKILLATMISRDFLSNCFWDFWRKIVSVLRRAGQDLTRRVQKLSKILKPFLQNLFQQCLKKNICKFDIYKVLDYFQTLDGVTFHIQLPSVWSCYYTLLQSLNI